MRYTGFTPHPKQREMIASILDSDAMYHVTCVGRQFGKSLMGINLALYWAINNTGVKVLWVSPVYSQTQKVQKEIMAAIGASGLVDSCNYSNNNITLKNGSEIIFRSAEKYDNIRGLTCQFGILDESAFMKSDAWTEAIRPIFLTASNKPGIKPKILFCSTPKGKNWFYDLFQLGNSPDHPNYKSYTGSSYDTPYIDTESIDDAKRTLPPNVFQQEYLAKFIDSGGEVFTNLDRLHKKPTEKAPYFIGVDFGKSNDWTCAIVQDWDGNIIDWYRDQKSEWTQMIDAIAKLATKWNATVMCEVNGVGDPLFEDLRRKYYNTYPFITTNKSKQEIIEGLILDVNNQEIGLPSRDEFPSLWSELETFTYDYNPNTRSIKYSHPPGLHDDTVIATAIVNYNRKQKRSSGYAVIGSMR
jgi:hypothetical protein